MQAPTPLQIAFAVALLQRSKGDPRELVEANLRGSTHLVSCELRLAQEPNPDELAALVAKAMARDLLDLAENGDTSSDDPLLSLRDGARRGNTAPLRIHTSVLTGPATDEEGCLVYTCIVVIS